jgi:chromosome segregation ATPase
LAELEMNDDDPVVRLGRELLEFEARFTRYIATIGTNDLLTRFLSELRAAQRNSHRGVDACGAHFERLRSLMTQIEEKMPIAQPLLQVDARFSELASALDSFTKALAGPQKGHAAKYEAELRSVSQQWAAIQALRKGHQTEQLYATVDDQLRQINKTLTERAAARASAIQEMRAVQSRMVAIRQERGRAGQQDREELDAEFEALMEQQSGLIERIAEI